MKIEKEEKEGVKGRKPEGLNTMGFL